jgi:hypothetical protein
VVGEGGPGGQVTLPNRLPNDPGQVIGPSGPTGLGLYLPPRPYQTTPNETVITTFQAGHGWTASGTSGGAIVADDTVEYCLGSQSVRITTSGTGASHEWRSPALGPLNLSSAQFVMAVRVEDFTNLSDFQIRVSSTNFVGADLGFMKPVQSSGTQRWIEPGKWHLITFTRAKQVASISWGTSGFQYSGIEANVDWTAITGIRFRLQDTAAGTATVRINYLGYLPSPPAPLLSIMFDDGRATHFTEAKKYMDKFRLAGTAAIIADSTENGGSAYMTPAQVKPPGSSPIRTATTVSRTPTAKRTSC